MGQTALDLALREGHKKIIQLLVQEGVKCRQVCEGKEWKIKTHEGEQEQAKLDLFMESNVRAGKWRTRVTFPKSQILKMIQTKTKKWPKPLLYFAMLVYLTLLIEQEMSSILSSREDDPAEAKDNSNGLLYRV